jgi:hypothetical protein
MQYVNNRSHVNRKSDRCCGIDCESYGIFQSFPVVLNGSRGRFTDTLQLQLLTTNFTMSNSSDDTYKKKGYDDDDVNCHYTTLEAVPLIDSEASTFGVTSTGNRNEYPGNRRIPSSDMPIPAGNILVRTAGNALQAIPVSMVEKIHESTPQLISVQIPNNTQPGDIIHVRPPYSDILIAATIPNGALPGQTIYVTYPSAATAYIEEMTTIETVATASVSSSTETSTMSNMNVAGQGVVPTNNDLHLYDSTITTTSPRG